MKNMEMKLKFLWLIWVIPTMDYPESLVMILAVESRTLPMLMFIRII